MVAPRVLDALSAASNALVHAGIRHVVSGGLDSWIIDVARPLAKHVVASAAMSESKNILKYNKHSVLFEMKLVQIDADRPDGTVSHRVDCFVNGHRVMREDYLAALEMAKAM